MNRSFLATLLAALGDEPKIDTLPENQLYTFTHVGTPVEHEFTREVLLKIARLQTLCVQASERGRMMGYEGVESQAEVMGTSAATVMANALGIQEDSTKQIMMLEWLIIEVVRAAVPAEHERFNVNYYLYIDGNTVMHRPAESRRFLD